MRIKAFLRAMRMSVLLLLTALTNISCTGGSGNREDPGNVNGNGSNGSSGDKAVLEEWVSLGETGLRVPVMAMGTGTHGWGGSSDQTRLGMDAFVRLARNAYQRGMRFYDMAEAYGSHRYVGEAIKGIPRDEIVLMTKITNTAGLSAAETSAKIDRFLDEVGTDYFDIVLMHYMTSGGWASNRQGSMQALTRAKEEGKVKAVGISCHSLDAMREAAESPWVDVILARINPFESNMDGRPDEVREVLALARRNGKGVIGMKIFGEGSCVKDDERERSLRYALTESNIHCMTIGYMDTDQMDDAVEKVVRIIEEQKQQNN